MRVLITGGTGFIGSHMVMHLLQHGIECVVIDNLSNSYIETIDRIKNQVQIEHKLHFHEVNITDMESLETIMRSYDKFDACIHFAGVKAVGESVQNPLKYYQNNVVGSYTLLKLLQKYNCRNLIFSSSSTVYGQYSSLNILETEKTSPINPYGRSKLIVEDMLKDISISEPGKWNIDILRYFNPVGGKLGEYPRGKPKNLFPYVLQVIKGCERKVRVFGDTYLTKDGTGVRDYIHVMDLVEAHFMCLKNIADRKKNNENTQCRTYNIGTEVGTSVLEVIKKFEEVAQQTIPYSLCSIRPGDVGASVCNTSKIQNEIGWVSKYTVADAIKDLLLENL